MSEAPETLWHYTDAHGLYGIITSSQLRFGDARFLNDRTERIYGEQVFDRAFDQELGSEPAPFTVKFREVIRALRAPERLYVCSFSETRESISQWQRYGADGSGYCIGFDRKRLDALFVRQDVSSETMLYNADDQLELLRIAIREAYADYRRLDRSPPPNPSYVEYLFLDMYIDSAMLRLKNPHFHDEREWRYIFRASDDQDGDLRESFAVRGPLIKPFVQLPLRPTSKLPIVGVICGPRLESDLAVLSVRRYLGGSGYSVDVQHSELAQIWR